MAVALLAGWWAVASTIPAAQAQQSPDDPAEARRLLEKRQRSLAETADRQKAIESDVAELAAERERINARLVETAALIQRAEGQMTAIESRLGELSAQEKIVRGSLAQRHDVIAKLLAAMQRMGRNPPPVMVTRREDALEMVRSAMLLARAFPELRDQAVELAGRLNELMRVMGEIRSEGDKLRAESQRLQDARTRLSFFMETKKRSLLERQQELADVRNAVAEITRNVTDLSELIPRLDRTVSEKTALGNYEREVERQLSQQQAPPTVAPAPPEGAAPPAVKPAPAVLKAGNAKPAPDIAGKGEVEVAVLAPQAGAALTDASRLKPAIPFQLAKARLPLPAQGRRVISFGEKTQYGGASKGIVIETRNGGQVTAPCDGWVVYAGNFRSYGQLLIINAGGGYHVLLAGMNQIDVQLGQFVLASEPVGTMSGSVTTRSQDSAPVLYVEFRKDGRPIDSEPWWFVGSQKVQG